MSMDNEKLRAEFEKWASENLFEGLTQKEIQEVRHKAEPDAYFIGDGPENEIPALMLSFAWIGWQASRAALVVELPTKVTQANGFDSAEDDEYYNLAIDHCSRQIRAAGITVKEGV